MNLIPRTRFKKLLGYPAFFLATFGLMLYVTFPYAAVAERLVAAAKRNQIDLSIGSIGPGLFGARAKQVGIGMPRKPGQTADPERIVLDSVSVRATLLPPGIKYSSSAFGGSIDGRIGVLGKRPHVQVRAKGVDLSKTNAKAALGLDLGGKLGAAVDLDLDRQDSSKTTGRIAFNGEGAIINGGTVANFDLPKVDLGHLEADLKIDQGKATVQSFKSLGGDVEAQIEGDISLAERLEFSQLNLTLKFKPGDDFLRKNSFIQTGLSFAMSKDSKGFYTTRIERMLGNPNFRPLR